MQISVYDTYVQRPDGLRMHFDILVSYHLSDQAVVLDFGREYLASKGLPPTILKFDKCNFCHIESANAAIESEIAALGYSIVEMENCV